jgi:hypothetical protein
MKRVRLCYKTARLLQSVDSKAFSGNCRDIVKVEAQAATCLSEPVRATMRCGSTLSLKIARYLRRRSDEFVRRP